MVQYATTLVTFPSGATDVGFPSSSATGTAVYTGDRRKPDFPATWPILIVVPRRGAGLHGEGERQAFADLPPFPDSLTDRLCRLVLLGLLPSVAERDLDRFGEALEELQRRVGQAFAPAQGGIFARPEAEAILAQLRADVDAWMTANGDQGMKTERAILAAKTHPAKPSKPAAQAH